MAKKKGFKFWAMLLAAFGAIAFVFRYGTPKVRFLRDGLNPSTAWGAELESANVPDKAKSVAWHIENDTPQFRAYRLKGWAIKQ